MPRTPATPLDQALAAIIDLLIALIAEHAAEHPMLAPGLRASIRQLEKLSRSLQAMVAEWQATRHQPRRPRAGTRRRKNASHTRIAPTAPRRLPDSPARGPYTHARAPPGCQAWPAHVPTSPGSRRTGAARAYALAVRRFREEPSRLTPWTN